MGVDQSAVRHVVERVCARQDALEACTRRDLGALVAIFGAHGVTQSQIAGLTGISQGRLSQYKTGKHLPSGASTFESFADGLGLPVQARLALGLAPPGGGSQSSASTGGLDVPTDTFDIQLLAEAVGRRGVKVRRRELLELAAMVGASTALAQSDVAERLVRALSKPSGVDETVVREIEARSAGFHQLEQLVPAPAVYRGIAAHLSDVGRLLDGTAHDPKDELRHRLIVVAGESSALAAWIATDRGDHAGARGFYEAADRAAKEANDPGILACALGYRSYAASMKGAHGRARALLGSALETLSGTESPAGVAWLAARHAEESAALGDQAQALRSWSQATEAHGVADPEEDRVWTRFMDQNRFDAFRISTFAGLGRLDDAHEAARLVMSRLAQSDRKKAAIVLGDIASASLAQGAVEDAVRLAREGLVAVRETQYAIWLPKFEELALGLSRWRSQPSVRSFLEDLAMTRRRFVR
jgi:transcriptional regulator with XRE-family HTH domain